MKLFSLSFHQFRLNFPSVDMKKMIQFSSSDVITTFSNCESPNASKKNLPRALRSSGCFLPVNQEATPLFEYSYSQNTNAMISCTSLPLNVILKSQKFWKNICSGILIEKRLLINPRNNNFIKIIRYNYLVGLMTYNFSNRTSF